MKAPDTARAAHLSAELRAREHLCGRLHSSFDRAANYLLSVDGEERLVTVLRGRMPLPPDSLAVPEEVFDGTRGAAEMEIVRYGEEIRLGDRRVSLDGRVSVNLFLPARVRGEDAAGRREHLRGEDAGRRRERLQRLDEFLRTQEKRSDLERLPARFAGKLEELAAAFPARDPSAVGEAFRGIAGAGHGLTPSCDDAAVGILACACAQLAHGSAAGFAEFRALVRGILESLLRPGRTTRVSEKYLKCACRGYFSEPICELMRWYFAGDGHPEPALRQIAATGQTSGMDTLFGVRRMLGGVEDVSIDHC